VRKPRVSVLLPVFRAEHTLGAALRSLLCQSHGDFECIVVDDGSPDGSLAVAAEAARRDPRITLIAEPHAGIVAALQRGLRACRGELVARMDADDLAHKDRLRLQVEHLDRHPTLGAVGAHVWMFPRVGMSDGLRAYEAWLGSLTDAESVRRDRFVECPIVHPTLLCRRELLLGYGYRKTPWHEDYDLVLRMLEAGEALGVVPKKLLGWRDGPDRLTRRAPESSRERLVACKAHYLARGFLAGADDYVLWGYGDTGRMLARALLAEGKRPSHILELHPRRLGQRILGAPVLRPDALPQGARRRIVVSVAGSGAREDVRRTAARLALVEGRAFVVAA